MAAARCPAVGFSAAQLTHKPSAAIASSVVGPMAANCRDVKEILAGCVGVLRTNVSHLYPRQLVARQPADRLQAELHPRWAEESDAGRRSLWTWSLMNNSTQQRSPKVLVFTCSVK